MRWGSHANAEHVKSSKQKDTDDNRHAWVWKATRPKKHKHNPQINKIKTDATKTTYISSGSGGGAHALTQTLSNELTKWLELDNYIVI